MAIRINKPDPEPEPIKEILARLFTARGWGRRQGRRRLDQVWAEAVGPEYEAHSRVVAIRRGTLEIEVDGAVLVQELTHYHKRRLLKVLRENLPGEIIKELRFRVGAFDKREK